MIQISQSAEWWRSGMNELEKVINGLESFKSDLKPFARCHADWEKVDDALAMLKAQEPRVMTLEDINQCTKETIWVEIINDNALKQLTQKEIAVFTFIGILNNWDGYNIRWRCWTSKPTDNQRANAQWKE